MAACRFRERSLTAQSAQAPTSGLTQRHTTANRATIGAALTGSRSACRSSFDSRAPDLRSMKHRDVRANILEMVRNNFGAAETHRRAARPPEKPAGVAPQECGFATFSLQNPSCSWAPGVDSNRQQLVCLGGPERQHWSLSFISRAGRRLGIGSCGTWLLMSHHLHASAYPSYWRWP
jgi:hypothetical protein